VTEYDWALVLGMMAWLFLGVAMAQVPFQSRRYGRVTTFQLPLAMRRIPPDEQAAETLRDPWGRMGWAGATAFFCVTLVVLWPVNAAVYLIRPLARRRKK
jgi:hypothetical protein